MTQIIGVNQQSVAGVSPAEVIGVPAGRIEFMVATFHRYGPSGPLVVTDGDILAAQTDPLWTDPNRVAEIDRGALHVRDQQALMTMTLENERLVWGGASNGANPIDQSIRSPHQTPARGMTSRTVADHLRVDTSSNNRFRCGFYDNRSPISTNYYTESLYYSANDPRLRYLVYNVSDAIEEDINVGDPAVILFGKGPIEIKVVLGGFTSGKPDPNGDEGSLLFIGGLLVCSALTAKSVNRRYIMGHRSYPFEVHEAEFYVETDPLLTPQRALFVDSPDVPDARDYVPEDGVPFHVVDDSSAQIFSGRLTATVADRDDVYVYDNPGGGMWEQEVRVSSGSNKRAHFVFRYIDPLNYWHWRESGTQWRLYERLNGIDYTRLDVPQDLTLSANQRVIYTDDGYRMASIHPEQGTVAEYSSYAGANRRKAGIRLYRDGGGGGDCTWHVARMGTVQALVEPLSAVFHRYDPGPQVLADGEYAASQADPLWTDPNRVAEIDRGALQWALVNDATMTLQNGKADHNPGASGGWSQLREPDANAELKTPGLVGHAVLSGDGTTSEARAILVNALNTGENAAIQLRQSQWRCLLNGVTINLDKDTTVVDQGYDFKIVSGGFDVNGKPKPDGVYGCLLMVDNSVILTSDSALGDAAADLRLGFDKGGNNTGIATAHRMHKFMAPELLTTDQRALYVDAADEADLADHDPEDGDPFTVVQGGLKIESGTAFTTIDSAVSMAIFDGPCDFMEADFLCKTTGGRYVGFVFRYLDADNFWLAMMAHTNGNESIRFREYVGGVDTDYEVTDPGAFSRVNNGHFQLSDDGSEMRLITNNNTVIRHVSSSGAGRNRQGFFLQENGGVTVTNVGVNWFCARMNL